MTGRAKLFDNFGDRLPAPDMAGGLQIDRLFPTAQALKNANLASIGLTGRRREIINKLATSFAEDPLFIHPAMPFEQSMSRLLAIKGIGPWTAEYIALRALRNPDAFPASDLVLLKSAGESKPKKLEARSNAWRPWRGYAALYLWNSAAQTSKKEIKR